MYQHSGPFPACRTAFTQMEGVADNNKLNYEPCMNVKFSVGFLNAITLMIA
jgi:hypothetical protein